MQDRRGNPVSTSSAAALDHAERALWRLMSFYGAPIDDLDAASASDPAWLLPRLMKAGFLLGLSEAGFARDGTAALDLAQPLLGAANDREQAHHGALRLLQRGDWRGACNAWETLLLAHPRDALALQWAHLFDFYRGDAANLRQRVARVLPEWDEADPLHPHVLALHAFGLEESNLYAQAEATGRRALAADPKSPWAVHAVAHVMEMQGRHEEGSAWMLRCRPEWSAGNGFSVHLGWHQALFALERLDTNAALALFDEHIAAAKTQVTLERVDTASLLWRLQLLGVDVGTRWRELLAVWNPQPDSAGHYAFNDLHALLALLGAGQLERAGAWLHTIATRAESADGTNRDMAREVGLPLMRGMMAFAEGRHDEAIGLMHPVRALAHRFGGSHAQRDLIDQTLLAASALGADHSVGRALLNERMSMKRRTPLQEHWAERIGITWRRASA
ncbi:MAG: tetratricopeptide repeat protein [Caldimonas sp.]